MDDTELGVVDADCLLTDEGAVEGIDTSDAKPGDLVYIGEEGELIFITPDEGVEDDSDI